MGSAKNWRDKVACPHCGKVVTRANLTKHRGRPSCLKSAHMSSQPQNRNSMKCKLLVNTAVAALLFAAAPVYALPDTVCKPFSEMAAELAKVRDEGSSKQDAVWFIENSMDTNAQSRTMIETAAKYVWGHGLHKTSAEVEDLEHAACLLATEP